MKHAGYPDGVTQASHDAAMGTDMDAAALNRVEAVLEGWARDEAEGVRDNQWFRAWLREYAPDELYALAEACATQWRRIAGYHGTVILDPIDAADRSQAADKARDALIAAYIAYRVGTFDDYDRADAEREAGDE